MPLSLDATRWAFSFALADDASEDAALHDLLHYAKGDSGGNSSGAGSEGDIVKLLIKSSKLNQLVCRRIYKDGGTWHVDGSEGWRYQALGKVVAGNAKGAGLPSFTCYAVRRGVSTALDRAGVPADTARRFIGHDPGTTTYEDHYVHKRSATDMQGILTGGAQQSERMRYQGLLRQTYAPLTAVQAQRAEGSDDVQVTNEKLKEDAYRKVAAAYGTTKQGHGSELYAKWEDIAQRCRLRRAKGRQEAQQQQEDTIATSEHQDALAQLFPLLQQSAAASTCLSSPSPSPQPQSEAGDPQQSLMDDTVPRSRALPGPRCDAGGCRRHQLLRLLPSATPSFPIASERCSTAPSGISRSTSLALTSQRASLRNREPVLRRRAGGRECLMEHRQSGAGRRTRAGDSDVSPSRTTL